MEDVIANKSCKLCCMEIPQKARKCPFCHHYQNRWTMFMFHPAFPAMLLTLPMAGMVLMLNTIFDKGKDYQEYKDQIFTTESRIEFGTSSSGPTVAVIGTLKNTAKVSWKDVYFHVDFLDAAGKRTDVGVKEDYAYYLPAGETSSFKVSFHRDFAETNYVKPVIRIAGAKDAESKW